EKNKQARQAFRNKQAYETAYRDYRGLVARKLGGTKPQNISQLNSERGGVNYLLASVPPPAWSQVRGAKVLNVKSGLPGWGWYSVDGGRKLNDRLWELVPFLKANPDKAMETRERRKEMERSLGEQLALYGAEVQNRMPPGWTRGENCQLPLCEQLWLDPERTQ